MNGKKTKLVLALTLVFWLLSNGGILSSHAEDEEHFSFYYEENPLYAFGYNFTSFYTGSNYTWDFGDGNHSYEQHPTHVYAAAGNYTVRLIVMEGGIEIVNESHILSTGNAPPIPDFMYTPNTPYTLETVFFIDNSTDPDGDIINWTWDFGDESDDNISYDKDPVHVYQKAGTYNVMLTVLDNEGKAESVVKQIIVFNRLPVASFYWTRNAITGDLIFDATTSYDVDGYIALYEWDFGDGTIKYGQIINHSYATAGAYTVTLKVYDDDGDNDTTSRDIHSNNKLPVVDFTYTPSLPTDLDVITFSSTSYDPDGTIMNYTWDFGDGSSASYNDTATHQYADDGIYYVMLKVVDNEGAYNSTYTPVTVYNVPPVASFSWTPTSPIPNKNITFNASSSYDLDGTIIAWSWSFGDGNGSSGEVVNYMYGEDGTYTVSLTVMDDDGATTTLKQELFIADFYVDENVFDPANHTWDKIQDAVDNATDGTFIYVKPGTYHEDVYINKSIQMVGENAVVKGNLFSFYFDRHGISIKNFVINGSISGIIVNSDNCLIENFTLLGNEIGVTLNGNDSIVRNSHIDATNTSFMIYGNENTVENNNVGSAMYGCQLHGDANVIQNNIFFGSQGTGVYGIYLDGIGNTIVDNAIYNANHGIYLLQSNEIINNTFTQCFNALKLAHFSTVGYNEFISNTYGINASTYFLLNDASFSDNHVAIACYDILAENLSITGGDYGIIADYGTFTNVVIDGAFVGVQVREHVELYNCSVKRCYTGVEGNSDGAIYNSEFTHNYVGIDHLQGIIENCSFTANTYGMKCLNNTVRSSTFSSNQYGILMMDGNTVEQCSFNGNTMAVDIAGEDNRVLHNEMDGNTHGIKIASSHNRVSHNTVSNSTYGIIITFSPSNTLFGNTLSANTYNFDMEGSKLEHFYQEIPENNTINGFNMTYLINQSDLLLSGEHGYLALINCTNATIDNVSISRNGEGVLIVHSENIRLNGCNFSYNLDGAYVLNGESLQLEGVSFTHNSNGVSSKSSTNLSFSYCHIADNTNGINLFNIERENSNVELKHSWVGRNELGANMENVEGVTVINTTFEENEKGLRAFNADVTVDHCAFADEIDMDIIQTSMTILYTEFSCTLAIKTDNATIFINNSNIHQADTGIHATSSTITVHNTTFENNSESMKVVQGTVSLKSCIFSNNTESIFYDALVHIQSSTFSGNAFALHLYNSSGTLSENNFMSNLRAVVLENGTSIDMVNLTIYENEYGIIVNTSASRIYGGTYFNNSCAITLTGNDNRITNVLFHHNSKGVVIEGDNNTLVNSSFWKNLYGVLTYGDNNTVYHNNFVHNVENARDYGNNIWNISYPEGGNFWHDYAGEDYLQGVKQNMSGSDGIGDIPYELYGSEDHYPLMTRYEHAAAVPNEPPVAQFYHYPVTAFSLETVVFVDASYDENGNDDIVSWHWDFGDGNTSSEKNPKHAYARYGIFNVTLMVEDREGSNNTTRMQVTVNNLAPVANFSWAPTDIFSYTLVDFNASASYDRDGTIMNYTWDFGDGTTSDDPVITHKYLTSGTYTVTLTVTDDAGETDVLELTLTVNNRKPDAEFTFDPERAGTGKTITFSDLSSDIDGEIVEWRWDFGDGSISYEQNPTHVYDRKGTYTVTLQVKDDEGAQANYSSEITITQKEIPSFEFIIAFVAIILVAIRRLKKFK